MATRKEPTLIVSPIVTPFLELLRPVAVLFGRTIEQKLIRAIALYLKTTKEICEAEVQRRCLYSPPAGRDDALPETGTTR